MKKLVMLVSMMLIASPVFAYYGHEEVSSTTIVNPTTIVDNEREQFSYGAGVDVVLLKPGNIIEEVRVDGRYNVEYKEYSAFVVAKINLTGK